jgi:hypothetical protein
MTPAILLATIHYDNMCFCRKCDKKTRHCCDTVCYKQIAKSMTLLYEIGSLYKTRGKSSNIFYHYIQMQYYSFQDKIKTGLFMFYYKYPPVCHYNKTAFSWPTRNRVFSIMSKPASSIFLQNATSSLHMSTNSIPSFPRIL